jgi:prostaglandin-endoperoxide synthase 2
MMGILNEILGEIHQAPLLGNAISRLAINHIASSTLPRPRAFSLWSHLPVGANGLGPVADYTSWPALTDRRYSGRHLPPAPQAEVDALPPLLQVLPLFERSGPMKTDRSSLLFMFFAQWFTDSVLRVDENDRRKNTSNHEIDLCQIYGLDEATANILRAHQGGKLRCQQINGESYLPYLFDETSPGLLTVKSEFKNLPYIDELDKVFGGAASEHKRKAYATGLKRGNSTIGYVAINTLFMREHNRICVDLKESNPGWDDERLFQTARMVNTVLLLKVVVEDYINHIAGKRIFSLETDFAEEHDWYRQNWIAIEFDLLYRWHSLVPDNITIKGQQYDASGFLNNNPLFEQAGLAAVLSSASQQKAGRIGLFNSPANLKVAEMAALGMGRAFRLASYNDYRVRFGMDRLGSIDQLTGDPAANHMLHQLYGNIDKVDFLVGIFAEERDHDSLFGSLLNMMVAYDAFTQIFTNPLLSRNVYNERTFTAQGLKLIENTRSVQDIASRNMSGPVLASLG